MTEVSRLLAKIDAGEPTAANDLLPLVYDELRKLATTKMANEGAGHSLSGTALVHEAYLRLIGDQKFDGRGHFFAAAAEAMRRILVESARKRSAGKRGGERAQVLLEEEMIGDRPDSEIMCVDEVVDQLAEHDSRSAQLVKLHIFAYNTQSMLGGALLGLNDLKAAEPMLIEGYKGLRKTQTSIPPQGKERITDALERLVKLYHQNDNEAEAASWQKELENARKEFSGKASDE